METNKFAAMINRQRMTPKIWDFSYLLLKNNLNVFMQFRDLAVSENKSRILDVGCGFKPWLRMFDKNKVEYIGVDFDKRKSAADFIASADQLPFPDNDFDALIYSEILEHTEDITGAVKEMRRVAKNNALIYISAPFIFPEHGIPYDFQRLTRYFYHKTFQDDEIILIKESNSSISTAFVAFNFFIEASPFRFLIGFKHLIHILNNTIGISSDLAVRLCLKILGVGFKEQFYSMPLGYALIVRVKK